MKEVGDDNRKESRMKGGDYIRLPRLRDPLTSKRITDFEMDAYFNGGCME